jgi:hypothetical protein
VDYRLREFRRVDYEKPTIEFVAFDSEKGRELLAEMCAQRIGILSAVGDV